jgi:WhiB family redox-sensing transcriptional regulator
MDWRHEAACRNENPDTFFPVSELDTATLAQARAVCARCPVGAECEDDGRNDGFGIRNGKTPEQRRPKKTPAVK